MTRAEAALPPECEFVVGGTRPDDVARLQAALSRRIHAVENGEQLPLLVPLAPTEDTETVRQIIRERLARGGGDAQRSGADVLVRTSGSTTGTGRLVCISMRALLASARATHAHLGGPGAWVVVLPTQHVAGLQMLVRSLEAGATPLVMDTSAGFSPEDLAAVFQPAKTAGRRVYVSLVPTQLRRVLDAGAQVRQALALADAVLVGGAAAAPELVRSATAAGIRVVTTYGMSETGGGCVYDGQPLAGVEIDLEPGSGRVALSGPMLASGYLDAPANTEAGGPNTSEFFYADDGTRRLRTADRAIFDDAGRLQVLGRLDDVIISGGLKIAPQPVEAALAAQPEVSDCCVVGIPDPQWGQAVVAVVVPANGSQQDEEALRARVRAQCGATHTPKRVLYVSELPLRGPGKVDRRRVAALAQERVSDR